MLRGPAASAAVNDAAPRPRPPALLVAVGDGVGPVQGRPALLQQFPRPFSALDALSAATARLEGALPAAIAAESFARAAVLQWALDSVRDLRAATIARHDWKLARKVRAGQPPF